ncbi:MAG: hypothetical protein WAT20_15655 [Ferruginibacter sp.]|nr:hypothetical protein [Chitinophagaceae bacterium]
MNWKAFITACISTAIISFPQNIIGCGPEANPYDYYTSFFHQNLPEAGGYRPFYYVGYQFLYDANEPASLSDLLANEWATYCGATVKKEDAKKMVNKFAWKDLNNLYYHLEKNLPLKIPDSVKQNSMTGYFMQSKDFEALGYILYAKQVEPYVVGGDGDWEGIQRDSLKMAKLIKSGQQLYAVAKKDIFKQKYAYQVLRLAHYSQRYTDAINWYDEYAAKTTTNSVLQPLSLALKAGALFRSGQQKEAAYLFSKVFAASPAKRISNYLGFFWSVDSKADKKDYLALCKNDQEKASMLALFNLGSTTNGLEDMKEIYRLNPASEELEVLVVREINKLEEKYLTPAMLKTPGGKPFYFTWTDETTDSIMTEAEKEVTAMAAFLHEAAQSKQVKNAGLLETAAGYAAHMVKDYASAKKYLSAAEKMPLTQKVKEQWVLTNLLVTINEKTKIDAAFEKQLVPSLQWLEDRVKEEKAITLDYWQVQQWRNIYRNLMSEILAKRYHEQGDLAKETLCIGAADYMMKGQQDYYGSLNGIDFLRNKLMSKDVENLYALITSTQPNKFESYLFTHNSVTKKEVVDFAGTSYLRDYDYAKAIEWFKRSSDKKAITKNPFVDVLYDVEEQLADEKNFSTSKLAFTQEMQKLEQAAKQPATAAKSYYKLALGMYNITYYGHTWELVQYYRSGSDGYAIPEKATDFQKEYYGAFKAKEYFEKALNASTDKNFKARCLFMMAKCAQKQVHQPQYSEYKTNWDKYDADQKAYWAKFKANTYFPQFVQEYSNTLFYKEAFSSCSYLRDFVKKK